MNVICNAVNLRKHSGFVLGNNSTPERVEQLRRECLNGFIRERGHISHSRAAHLGRIDKILGTCGVEGMLLDGQGNDVSGSCDESQVKCDIQYCNAGDTYATTIFYWKGKLRIGDWGSVVERLL